MKVIKSFIYGKYAATVGANIDIKEKEIAEMLVKKKILEEERSGVNVNKENKN